MEDQEKNTETPKLDIKQFNKGVITELKYSGTTILITKEEHTRLINKAKKVNSLRQELAKVKTDNANEIEKWRNVYELETSRLKNQLAEMDKKACEELEKIKILANRKLTESQKQEQKVKALLEQQGKGRPSKLTQEHKIWIQQAHTQLRQQGKKFTIKDFYKELVVNHGYTGNYEGVRAYISESMKKREWLP